METTLTASHQRNHRISQVNDMLHAAYRRNAFSWQSHARVKLGRSAYQAHDATHLLLDGTHPKAVTSDILARLASWRQCELLQGPRKMRFEHHQLLPQAQEMHTQHHIHDMSAKRVEKLSRLGINDSWCASMRAIDVS